MAVTAAIDNGLPEMPKPDEDMLRDWNEWVASRPEPVRSLCEKFPPWQYYDMPKTSQIVVVEAWSEDGTMRSVK